MNGFDYLTDHLSTSDRELILDKTARYLAEILARQQQGQLVYRGQAAIAERLGCARGSVALLMSSGRLRYNCVGKKKGYETTEEAILEYQRAA